MTLRAVPGEHMNDDLRRDLIKSDSAEVDVRCCRCYARHLGCPALLTMVGVFGPVDRGDRV